MLVAQVFLDQKGTRFKGDSMKNGTFAFEQFKLFITIVVGTVIATVVGLLVLHQLRRWALISSSKQAITQTQEDIKTLEQTGCTDCGDAMDRLQARLARKEQQAKLLTYEWLIPSKKDDLERLHSKLLLRVTINKKMLGSYLRSLREYGNMGIEEQHNTIKFAQYQVVVLAEEQRDLMQQLQVVQAARDGNIMRAYSVLDTYQDRIDYYKTKLQKYYAQGLEPQGAKVMRCKMGLCQVVKERDLLERILDY